MSSNYWIYKIWRMSHGENGWENIEGISGSLKKISDD